MPTVFITGTSSGIGRGTAKRFLAHGWNVAGTQLPGEPEQEQELRSFSRCRLYELDVTDREQIPRTAERVLSDFGAVDVVVNNAGVGLMGPLELADYEQIARIFQVNLLGYVLVTQAFLPAMRKAGRGVIVNVGALGGRLVHPGLGYYNMTKAAVAAFSEELLLELSPLGIDVKLIEPSGVRTNMGSSGTVFLPQDRIPDYDYFFREQLPRTGAVVDGAVIGTEEFYPPIEPEEMGEIIFQAAVNGGDTFRFQSGPHARRLLEERAKMTDQEYITLYKKYFRAERP